MFDNIGGFAMFIAYGFFCLIIGAITADSTARKSIVKENKIIYNEKVYSVKLDSIETIKYLWNKK